MKTKILFTFIVFKILIPNKCCPLIMERYWNPVSERYWNPVSERCWNPVSERCWDPMSERCWDPVPNRSYISTFIRHRSNVGNRCRSDTGMSAADIGTTLFQYWNPTWVYSFFPHFYCARYTNFQNKAFIKNNWKLEPLRKNIFKFS